MDETSTMHFGEMQTKFALKTLKGRKHLGELGIERGKNKMDLYKRT